MWKLVFKALLALTFFTEVACAKDADTGFKKLTDTEVSGVASELCTALQFTQDVQGYDHSRHLNRILAKSAGVDLGGPGFEIKLASFFNYHTNKMICTPSNGIYPRQHIFKRAIEMNVETEILSDYFFRDPTAFPINPNALELLSNGKRSTVLDYIKLALALADADSRYDVELVSELQKYLVETFGAKTSESLSK